MDSYVAVMFCMSLCVTRTHTYSYASWEAYKHDSEVTDNCICDEIKKKEYISEIFFFSLAVKNYFRINCKNFHFW